MRKIDPRNFQRATRTTTKEINRQIVLNLVREYQPISRADLARRMEVARGIVTPLVNELIDQGLLVEGATGASPRGRKPTLLHVRSHDRLAVAVDVRLSETQLMLSDFSGRPLATEILTTPEDPDELVLALTARIRRLLDAHGAAGVCEGVGLVVPGMVDSASGKLVHAPTLGWRDVDLRSALEIAVGLPVHIERDAVACALAQMWMGQGAEGAADSFAYVTFSDGVGAGLVMGGNVVRGHRDAAGEFGHIPLSLDGPACLCGSRGCWEAYTSNQAVVARYLGRELSTRDSYAQVRETRLTVADVVARARAGDDGARTALELTGRYIGLGLSAIVNALNPARLIVGGEIAGGWDLIRPAVLQSLAERTLTQGTAATPVIPEPHDPQTRLRGAAALVVAPVFAAPEVG
ncbi:ROK family transcriptional regulator [Longimicrobium sp.]|uniref:ROK family transcriptional regulator n=1 Tax=Longimicrobium sp. TaxID=2029185 RepID=UPI002E3102D1|nr:ROK family protein [Longimicrobium sp.]HEX6041819.1 ROK family protein [Longimicrobium sp.]